jgi:hypothetical protein
MTAADVPSYRTYTRDSTDAKAHPEIHKIDFSEGGFAEYIWFYIFCGLLDSMWQTAAYWMMGAMSNDPSKLAHFAGFYKSIQSAGGAGTWRADAQKISYMTLFASTWGLLVGGLLFMLPMIYMRVQNHQEETVLVLSFFSPVTWLTSISQCHHQRYRAGCAQGGYTRPVICPICFCIGSLGMNTIHVTHSMSSPCVS